MNIGNLKIGTRLGLGFGLLLILLVGGIAFGISSLHDLDEGTRKVVNDKYPKAVYVFEIQDIVNRNARNMRNMLLSDDPAEVEKERQSLLSNKKQNSDNYRKLDALMTSEEGKDLLQKVLSAKQQYGVSQKEFMDLVAAGKKQEATTLLMTGLRKDQKNYFEALRELIKQQADAVTDSGKQAEAIYVQSRVALICLAVLALGLGIGVAVWITRSIVRPLGRAVEVAHTVAAGDLSSTIDVTTTDEVGLLLRALKEMNDSLVGIVSEVRAGADTIATASGQIASGNVDLSSRTAEQASSLEETASSMEQITAAVRHNADHARRANALATKASDVAVKGGAVVSQVVATMGSINASSKKIVDIINVIDGIAFQTNILALNAAVEAARAGEQGRGFAVVATEVRNLAQRSASAAKEIKVLIDDSVDKVGTGSVLVDQAGETMSEIVESIRHVTDIMGEITTASLEQTSGIEQINQAITQMDGATQQNAALVEEAAAAAQSMRNQANSLAHVVGVFTLSAASARQAGTVVPFKVARLPAGSAGSGYAVTAVQRIGGTGGAGGRGVTTVNGDVWTEF